MIVSDTQRTNSKFLRPEWTASNKLKSATAELERSRAEKLCGDIDVIIDDTSKMTLKVQRDVNRKLEQRLRDVEHWKEEVSERISRANLEIDAMEAYNVRLNKALESLKDPMHIIHQCLVARERRRGIELVHDDAEKELLREIQIAEGIRSLLIRTQEQLTEQIRLARKMRYKLEKDLSDKEVAIDIDKQNIELENHASLLQLKPNNARGDKKTSSIGEWESFSIKNIQEADKVLSNCSSLRGIVDNILIQVSSDLEEQKGNTDEALAKRISETRDAKHKLEDQLAMVKSQILMTEKNFDKILKAIQDKETPRRLAETRIGNRSYRPNVELCLDLVQVKLLKESQLIDQSVEKLKQAGRNAEICLNGLRQKQLEIEEDVALKNETLQIDEGECKLMRKSIIIRQF